MAKYRTTKYESCREYSYFNGILGCIPINIKFIFWMFAWDGKASNSKCCIYCLVCIKIGRSIDYNLLHNTQCVFLLFMARIHWFCLYTLHFGKLNVSRICIIRPTTNPLLLNCIITYPPYSGILSKLTLRSSVV